MKAPEIFDLPPMSQLVSSRNDAISGAQHQSLHCSSQYIRLALLLFLMNLCPLGPPMEHYSLAVSWSYITQSIPDPISLFLSHFKGNSGTSTSLGVGHSYSQAFKSKHSSVLPTSHKVLARVLNLMS